MDNINLPEDEKFYTGNINVVAYLKTRGVNYVEVKEDCGRKLFGFLKSEKFEMIMKEYSNNHFLKDFLKNLKSVKTVAKNW